MSDDRFGSCTRGESEGQKIRALDDRTCRPLHEFRGGSAGSAASSVDPAPTESERVGADSEPPQDPMKREASFVGVGADMNDLLVKIIGGEDFSGRDELLAQLDHLRVVGRPVTFYKLEVDRAAAPPSPIETTRVPGNAWAYDGTTPLGTLIVWVADGYISGLEYGWVSDEEPTDLPSAAQVRAL